MAQPPIKPLSKAARNEQRKLLGTALNASAVGMFGLGVLQPLVAGSPDFLRFVLWSGIGVILHFGARSAVSGLED